MTTQCDSKRAETWNWVSWQQAQDVVDMMVYWKYCPSVSQAGRQVGTCSVHTDLARMTPKEFPPTPQVLLNILIAGVLERKVFGFRWNLQLWSPSVCLIWFLALSLWPCFLTYLILSSLICEMKLICSAWLTKWLPLLKWQKSHCLHKEWGVLG